MKPSKGAVLVSTGVADGRAISSYLEHFGLAIADVDILACQTGMKCDGAYDCLLLVTSQVSAAELAAAAKALRNSGQLMLDVLKGSEDLVKSEVLLSGFTDVSTTASRYASTLQLTAKKPNWSGAKAGIRLKARAAPVAPAPAPAPNGSIWNIDVADDEEMVDEEELLTEEDKQRPVLPASDCEVGGGKKACANCTCGRADAEARGEQAKLTPEMLANPQSSCGSCGLGDAFRCAGCPYRGLPQFQMGQKIELPRDFLTADA